MSRSIALFLSRISKPPHQGSVGYVNNAIPPALRRGGWDVGVFHAPAPTRVEEAMLPFGFADFHSRHASVGVSDVALYDDAGTTTTMPSRRWAKKNAVIYHGLVYGANAWMTNPEIDLHCANSPYLARVLRALFAFPDWKNRRCLDARAFDFVTDIRLPVPCVANPDGDPGFSHGSNMPPVVQTLLNGGWVLGHALQPRKQDWAATVGVLHCLNETARKHGQPGVKLLVSDASLDNERRRALDAFLAQRGYRCDDLFVPLPPLNQRALFQLLRVCRFGLAYNIFPEPFGFYVLESIHNGCPVYTNGVGNNRFLLPADHGMVVHETAAMSGSSAGAPDVLAYQGVAERILSDLSRNEDTQQACARGAGYIDREWSPAAFEDSLAAALDRLDEAQAALQDFDALEVGLSPLVRSFDPATGRMLSDYASGVLDPSSSSILRDLIGRSCADLPSSDMQALEANHGFFRRGILSLHRPHAATA